MDDYNNQNNFNQNNQNNQYNQPYQYQQGGQYNPNQQYNQAYQYPQYQENPEPGKNLAIASLVLGIASFFCCGTICSILGIIFGVMSKSRQKENNGMATAGIVLSVVALVLGIIGIVVGIATGLFDYYAYYNFY